MFWQILRFLSSGGLGVLLYYLILYFLTEVMGLWYMASAIAASLVNYGVNFLLVKFWAFENKDTKNIHKQAGKYATLAVTLFSSNLILLYVLVELGHLWYLTAQLIVTVILTVASYLVSRRIFTN